VLHAYTQTAVLPADTLEHLGKCTLLTSLKVEYYCVTPKASSGQSLSSSSSSSNGCPSQLLVCMDALTNCPALVRLFIVGHELREPVDMAVTPDWVVQQLARLPLLEQVGPPSCVVLCSPCP
jgi:hypothetical protein